MAFRSIGELAGTVLQNAKTAAHADKLRMNLGGGLTGEEPINPPETLYGIRGEPERNVNKGTGAVEAPASFNGRKRVKHGGRTALDTPLTMSRSMATVYSTAPHRESFPRSAVVIDLCMWKEAHVRSNSLTGTGF